MDTQRTSALPRPLSKLPAPRSFGTGISKPPPVQASSAVDASFAQHHASKLSSGSVSTASSHNSASSVTSFSSSRPPTGRKASNECNGVPAARSRPPLQPPHRPQSQQGPNQPSQRFFGQDHQGTQVRAKATRNTSQQENALELWDSPEESDGSSNNPPSPLRTLRKPPRLSLSDRTVDSLAHMSPMANRRRSSFFNPDSPMATPAKPPSSTSHSAMPKSNFGSLRRGPAFAKPASPVKPASPPKRPDSRIGVPSTPTQKGVGSALPRTAIPSASTTTHARSKSAIKPPARPSSVMGMTATPSKSSIGTRAPGTSYRNSMIVPRNAMLGVAASKPAPQLQKQQTSALNRPKRPMSTIEPLKRLDTTPAATAAPPLEQGDSSKDSPSSSAALRAQIAQARATHRKAAATPSASTPSTYEFASCDDPFNQGSQQDQSLLAKRIDSARRDGRLNIAALSLKQIPDKVMQMYDSEAMEASSVAWNETVDLVRFNAADNEMAEISDEAFPDLSIEELAQGVDARGNQFGGIEALDLHGNVLTRLPMGLRRLERLTTLNLSRNKLDNQSFEVIFQITSLRELRLGDNELTRELPEGINKLSNLEVLDLHSNKLSVLPKTVRDLVNLKVLNLSENRFAELPLGSLFSLPNLLEIYVATNALTGAFFPNTVDIVRSLQTLDVSNNSLAALSFASDLHLPALQHINVSRNRLFAFPDVASWSSLLNLLAEENGLTTLPPGFSSLKQLRIADFSRNSLRAIEAEVGQMEALETLNVASNPLREKRLLNMSTAEIKADLVKRLEASGQ